MEKIKLIAFFIITIIMTSCSKEDLIQNDNNLVKNLNNVVWKKKELSTGENLNKILFITNKLGFIIGDKGKLFKTDNGGVNWTNVVTNVTHNLKSISYDGSSDIIINGLISQDKGQTWKILESTKNYYCYYVTKDVLIGGSTSTFKGDVHRSTDNGKTWSKVFGTSPKTGYYINGMFQDNVGYLLSWYSGRVLKTTDGGLNWSVIVESADKPEGGKKGYDDFSDIFIKDKNSLYVTSTGYILKSTNQGGKFNVLKTSRTDESYSGITVNDKNVAATSSLGQIYISVDQGKKWKEYKVSSKKLIDVAFSNEHVFVIGENGELWSSLK